MSDVPPRLLKDTLRDRLETPPGASPGCLDVDVLAAWSDGKLSRRDRAAAESHAATCSRCQAMVAAMAKTAHVLPARKWWQASSIRWLVPVATVSALAVVVLRNVPIERQAAPAARFEVSTSPAPAPVRETPAAEIPASPASSGTLERRVDAKRREQVAETAPSAVSPVPSATEPPAPSSAVQKEEPAAQTFRARDTSPAPAPVQPSLRSASAGAVAETVMILPPQVIADKSTAALDIQSPRQEVRWRIVAGRTIERSTDGGATWQAQSTGATVRLTAGAAPSPTICWLVGPAGVVLVSRDGRTWQRVPFPEAVDLTAIRAASDSSATVTAADGRVFITTDGGKTWR